MSLVCLFLFCWERVDDVTQEIEFDMHPHSHELNDFSKIENKY